MTLWLPLAALILANAAPPPPKAVTSPAAPMPTAAAAGPVQGDPEALKAQAVAPDSITILVRIPVLSEQFADVPLATIDGDPILSSELATLMARSHEQRQEGAASGRPDYGAMLERLVTVRLIVAEARNIGLDEIDELKAAVAKTRQSVITATLRAEAEKGAKPDPVALEKQVIEAGREVRLSSVLFTAQADAAAFVAATAGGDLNELARKAVTTKKAAEHQDSEWVPRKTLLPEVTKAIATLSEGQVCGPVAVGKSWAVIRYDGARQNGDPKIREAIEGSLRAEARGAALKRYYQDLLKQHVKADQALVLKLDFEAARPGMPALKKDQRVLVRIKGAAPITVAELAAEIEKGFFHGLAEAQAKKNVNVQKIPALDSLISRRLTELEAARLHLDERNDVKRRITAYEQEALFGTFVQKVVVPGVSVQEAEVRAAYERMKAELTFPAFYKLDTLALKDAAEARAALKKLQAGTNMAWLRTNTDGQVPEADRSLQFGDRTIIAHDLPEGLRRALDGAQDGDLRLHDEGDQHYVIQVVQVTPPRLQTYEEARKQAAQAALGEAVSRSLTEWATKLRQSHEVKTFFVSDK